METAYANLHISFTKFTKKKTEKCHTEHIEIKI